MRRTLLRRLPPLLAVLLLCVLAVPPAAHAYPSCPAWNCSDLVDYCTSLGGTPTLTWRGLCIDQYYYGYEYYSLSCSGVLYECAGYSWW